MSVIKKKLMMMMNKRTFLTRSGHAAIGAPTPPAPEAAAPPLGLVPNRRDCWVSGFRVRVQGSGFRVQGSGFRVQGSGFKAQCSKFGVQLNSALQHQTVFCNFIGIQSNSVQAAA